MTDPDQPCYFPSSIQLGSTLPSTKLDQDDPDLIFLHPHSFWSIDIRDEQLSMSSTSPLFPSLPQEYKKLRFPTRVAFLDSLITTKLEPPFGYRSLKFTMTIDGYIGYFQTYTLCQYPRVLESGEFESEHAEVLAGLRPENQISFDRTLRNNMSSGWLSDVKERRAALERAG